MDIIILKEIKANCYYILSTAYCLLNASGFIAFSIVGIKDTILPAASNSYLVLCNAWANSSKVEAETFGTFINWFRGYFMREHQFKRKCIPLKKTELLMPYLYRIYRDLFLQICKTKYKSRSSSKYIYRDLKYINIAYTFSKWAKDLLL